MPSNDFPEMTELYRKAHGLMLQAFGSTECRQLSPWGTEVLQLANDAVMRAVKLLDADHPQHAQPKP